jgi:hypothetical protein
VCQKLGRDQAVCANDLECDQFAGFLCHRTNKRCVPFTVVTGAGTCGTYDLCPANGSCSAGRCVPGPADGAACTDTGPAGTFPAECTAGTCRVRSFVPACPNMAAGRPAAPRFRLPRAAE